MKSGEWKTYRTRFLVQAKQLNSPLTFVDPLGRQHCGRKGDYLVEASDGRISIAPRQIFEDIYVPISPLEERQEVQKQNSRNGEPANLLIGGSPIAGTWKSGADSVTLATAWKSGASAPRHA